MSFFNNKQGVDDKALSNQIGILSGAKVYVESFPIQTPETDDTARINRAIQALRNLGGGRLLFTKTAYSVSGTFITDFRIIVEGLGNNTTVISRTADVTMFNCNPVTRFLGGWGFENVQLQGRTTDTQPLVDVGNISFASMRNVNFQSSGGNAIKATTLWDSTFENIVFRNCGNVAGGRFALELNNGTDNCNELRFIDCHFEHGDGGFIKSDSSASGTNRNNSIHFIGTKFEFDSNGTIAPIQLNNAEGWTFLTNRFTYYPVGIMQLTNCYNIKVKTNRCYNNSTPTCLVDIQGTSGGGHIIKDNGGYNVGDVPNAYITPYPTIYEQPLAHTLYKNRTKNMRYNMNFSGFIAASHLVTSNTQKLEYDSTSLSQAVLKSQSVDYSQFAQVFLPALPREVDVWFRLKSLSATSIEIHKLDGNTDIGTIYTPSITTSYAWYKVRLDTTGMTDPSLRLNTVGSMTSSGNVVWCDGAYIMPVTSSFTQPVNPSKGDIYYDDPNSQLKAFRYTSWQPINFGLSGTTAGRPQGGLYPGMPYFDTTLGRPVWRNTANTAWVDATGTTV